MKDMLMSKGIFFILPIFLFLASCSGMKDIEKDVKKEKEKVKVKEPVMVTLQGYEKAFNPAKYNLDYKESIAGTSGSNTPSSSSRRTSTGYRIQVVIASEFDECQQRRKDLQSLFPEQKTYIVHEFPFYKLRMGNFKTRKDAETYLEKFDLYNIKNIQIVPDRIVIE